MVGVGDASANVQIALAIINAVQIVLLAVINSRTRSTAVKLNGHLQEHVDAAREVERARQLGDDSE